MFGLDVATNTSTLDANSPNHISSLSSILYENNVQKCLYSLSGKIIENKIDWWSCMNVNNLDTFENGTRFCYFAH